MKIYISADIEGVTGATHWDETELDKAESAPFREQMTAETVAACEGALEAGATEIWVKDAHDSARNLIASRLPRAARLIRGWSRHPLMMMQELDETFDAALLIGYHSRAASDRNPLAHTLTGAIMRMRLYGRDASEFLVNAFAASSLNVPVVFVSGDKGLCEDVTEVNPNIGTVAVKEGRGASTISIHPDLAAESIKTGVIQALKRDRMKCLLPIPPRLALDVEYKDPARAYQFSFYPGAKLTDPVTVRFETDQYFEILRFLLFAS